jgi:hypothetical protein
MGVLDLAGTRVVAQFVVGDDAPDRETPSRLPQWLDNRLRADADGLLYYVSPQRRGTDPGFWTWRRDAAVLEAIEASEIRSYRELSRATPVVATKTRWVRKEFLSATVVLALLGGGFETGWRWRGTDVDRTEVRAERRSLYEDGLRAGLLRRISECRHQPALEAATDTLPVDLDVAKR